MAKNSSDASLYFKLGILYSLKGFLKEAEDNYCVAISLDPYNIDYNFALAYLYYLNKKISLAEVVVNYTLSIESSHVRSLALKLMILISLDKITEADVIVKRLLKIIKEDDFAYYALGTYYSYINNWGKTEYILEKAVELKPDSIEYNSLLAKSCLELKKYKKTVELCEKIKEINKNYILAYIYEAEAYLKLKENEKALCLSEFALKLDINDGNLYRLRGDIYYNLADYDKAIENYKQGLLLMPAEESLYEKIAKSYYNQADYETSYLYYKEASEINITNAQYFYYMAKCSEHKKDIEETKRNYFNARRIQPNNLNYLKEYVEFLMKSNEKKEAMSVLKSSLKNYKEEDDKMEIKDLIKKLKK